MSSNVALTEQTQCAIRPGNPCRPLSLDCSAHCSVLWGHISPGARTWLADALEASGDTYAATLARGLPVRDELAPLVIRRRAA